MTQLDESAQKMRLQAILSKLDRGGSPDSKWPDYKGEYWALCPYHDDRHPENFSVSERGAKCFVCQEKGVSIQALAERLGIDWRAITATEPARPSASFTGCTLEEYAQAKHLDIDALRSYGLSNGRHYDPADKREKPAVIIPYKGEQGQLLGERHRVDLHKQQGGKDNRFRWRTGDKADGLLYGIWRLPEIWRAGWVVLVEGESDCHTLWQHGIPALGIPGAATWDNAAAQHLDGLAVYAWDEQDRGGKTLLESLARAPIANLQAISHSDYKDVSDAHIMGEDIPQLIEQAKANARRLEDLTDATEGEDAPVIVLSNTFQHERMATYERILQQINAGNPTVFLHSGRLVVIQGQAIKIDGEELIQPTIKEMNKELLSCLLSKHARFVHVCKNRDGETYNKKAQPTARDMSEYLARGGWPFPSLAGIIQAPTIRPDGTILQQAGYDDMTGLYYFPESRLSVPPISNKPTESERTEAINLLLEAVRDFPFVGKEEEDKPPELNESRANALAAILTPVLRPAMPKSDIPAPVINGTQQGSGKGLLTDIMATIATGSRAAVMTKPDSEEEARKKITSLLMAGASIISIDNLVGVFDSAQLAAALTCKIWQDRVLGSMEIVKVPMVAVFVANGNNVILGGDLPRRCYPIRIDPQCGLPWQRTGFLHDPLLPWILENRGRFIWAILTLARAWFVAGKPAGDVKPMATFTEWARTIGGILEMAGVRGFLGNLDEFYETSDPEQDAWHTFLSEWHRLLGERRLLAGDLIPYLDKPDPKSGLPAGALYNVLPDNLREIIRDGGSTKRVAKALATQEGRTHTDGVRLERHKDRHTKLWLWSVSRATSPTQGPLPLGEGPNFCGIAVIGGVSGKPETNQYQESGDSDLFPSAENHRQIPQTPQNEQTSGNGHSPDVVRIPDDYRGRANWCNKDHDELVEITGYAGEKDGVRAFYVLSRVDGHKGLLPESELISQEVVL